MQPITELTSRYRLESLIAAGGMGEVGRADDVVLEAGCSARFRW